MKALDEVPISEVRLFDSQWSNIVNGASCIEDAVKRTEDAMRDNLEKMAFPPPRAWFTKSMTDLREQVEAQSAELASLRARLLRVDELLKKWQTIDSFEARLNTPNRFAHAYACELDAALTAERAKEGETRK